MREWSLDPVLGQLWVPLVAGFGLCALLFLSPSYRQVSRFRRAVLLSLRAVVIGLLTVAMLRPAYVSTVSRPQNQVLVLLFDMSRSMQLPHVAGGPSRWDAQRTVLKRAQEILRDLPTTMELKVYGYDSQLHVVGFDGQVFELPEQPHGDQTDIGTSLAEAVRRETGKRVAAVVMLGDGTQTAFDPRVDLNEAGRELARLGFPLFTLVFGPSGDVAQSRDLVVESLPEQYTVFVKNELPVRGQIRVRGYANQDIPVEMAVESLSDGKKVTVGPRLVRVKEDGESASAELRFIPDKPGQYRLTMRVAPQPGELDVKNNELTSFLTVLDGGLRVAYLYGELLGEQRLLRRSLNQSAEIELEDIYVDPRNRDRWPIDLGELLTPPRYDVLLLESVESAAIGTNNLTTIAKGVEQGRGLMMVGGFHSFAPGGYALSPLADVLPIKMNRLEKQDPGALVTISRDLHLWGKLTLIPVRPHAVTQLVGEADNVAHWQQLPPLNGANRFTGLTDRAIVLLETPDHVPLLVAGNYGRGRVLAFAGNTTGKWWQRGKQADHRRFWRQAILWLAQRDGLEQNDVWLKLDQRRFAPGAKMVFKGGAKSTSGDVIQGASYRAEWVSPQGAQGLGERREVRLTSDGEQVSGTLEAPQQGGDYLLEMFATANGQPLGKAQVSFQVLDRDVELSNPIAGHDQMARLAALTAEAGGKVVSTEEFSSVLENILTNPPEATVEIQAKWRLADSPIDAWLLLLLVAVPLISEWTLRKRWGLV